jgi:hypothetical protein
MGLISRPSWNASNYDIHGARSVASKSGMVAGTVPKRATPEEEAAIDQKLGLHMVALRLPTQAIEEFKRRAAEKGIGYQPYVRQLIMDHIKNSSLEDRVKRLEDKLLKSG